jgi:hypothetical protein
MLFQVYNLGFNMINIQNQKLFYRSPVSVVSPWIFIANIFSLKSFVFHRRWESCEINSRLLAKFGIHLLLIKESRFGRYSAVISQCKFKNWHSNKLLSLYLTITNGNISFYISCLYPFATSYFLWLHSGLIFPIDSIYLTYAY